MEVKGVAKNPLAIIALFISFMYGSASLILGTSIDTLDELSRRALVAFLIFFPIVIFGSFLFLVVRHHRKLYAPADYRSDESFLAGVETVLVRPQADDQETDEKANDAGVAIEPHEQLSQHTPEDATAPAAPEEPSTAATAGTPVSSASPQARLAESLAVDLYQRKYGGLLKRNVRFVSKSGRKFIFDFAIEVRETVYVGEVKYTRTGAVKTAANAVLGRFFLFNSAEINDHVRFVKIGVVVVEDRREFVQGTGPGTEIRRRITEVRAETGVPDVILEAYTMTELINLVATGKENAGVDLSTTPT